MNMQHNLIQEVRLDKFKLGHDTVEATKNTCYTKDEKAIDHSTVIRWFKKFCYSGYTNLDDQARSARPKAMDSKTVL